MKILVVFLLFSLLFLVSSAQAAKLFIIGGALEDDNSLIFNALRATTHRVGNYNCSLDWNTTPCPRIAVVISGSMNLAAGIDVFNTDDAAGFKGLSYFHLFKKWGFSPKLVQIAIDNYTTASTSGNTVGDANIALIKQADIVFFNGGDQSYHARSWIKADGTDSPLLAILRSRVNQDAVVIAGTSAGTAVQGKYIYGEGNSYGYLTFNDLAPKAVDDLSGLLDIRAGNSGFQYDNNGGKMQGFGFLARHLAFDTHFDNRARLGRMIVAMKNIGTTTGIGVDENTALSIHDDIATVYGEHGVFLADSSKAFFSAATKHMNETGVRVSLLTNGDSYSLKNKKIHSTKKLILKPQFSGSVESHNLFGSYINTELMTHLIDQTGNINLSFSDPARPGFKYRFRKDKKSFGNLSNEKYTVQNIIMDILDI